MHSLLGEWSPKGREFGLSLFGREVAGKFGAIFRGIELLGPTRRRLVTLK